MSRDLTAREEKAIADLQRLAKTWPKTLKLFSWSGSLVVFDADQDIHGGRPDQYVLAAIHGIPNDGGDP